MALDIKAVAPEYQPLYLLLSDIWMRKYEKAETEEEKADALKEMKAATDELAYRAGRDDKEGNKKATLQSPRAW